mmetsp:Transcript_73816/g.213842  ORF Transcript_73816/g.213842 Transcript_73816/m.213842 type:complete len:225 (+) Transcript_73816:44-718(+)
MCRRLSRTAFLQPMLRAQTGARRHSLPLRHPGGAAVRRDLSRDALPRQLRRWRPVMERFVAQDHGDSVVAQHGAGIGVVLEDDALVLRLELQPMRLQHDNEPRGVRHSHDLRRVDAGAYQQRRAGLAHPARGDRVDAVGRHRVLDRVLGARVHRVSGEPHQHRCRGLVLDAHLRRPRADGCQRVLDEGHHCTAVIERMRRSAASSKSIIRLPARAYFVAERRLA